MNSEFWRTCWWNISHITAPSHGSGAHQSPLIWVVVTVFHEKTCLNHLDRQTFHLIRYTVFYRLQSSSMYAIVPQLPCRSHNNSLKGRRKLAARKELAIFRDRGRRWEPAVSTLFPWPFSMTPPSSLWNSFLGLINLMLSWFSSYLFSPSQSLLLVLLPFMH